MFFTGWKGRGWASKAPLDETQRAALSRTPLHFPLTSAPFSISLLAQFGISCSSSRLSHGFSLSPMAPFPVVGGGGLPAPVRLCHCPSGFSHRRTPAPP